MHVGCMISMPKPMGPGAPLSEAAARGWLTRALSLHLRCLIAQHKCCWMALAEVVIQWTAQATACISACQCGLCSAASAFCQQFMQPLSTCPRHEMLRFGYWPVHHSDGSLLRHLAQIAPALLSPDLQCCSVEHCASEHELGDAQLIPLFPFTVAQIISNFRACRCCMGAICKPCQTCWSATAAWQRGLFTCRHGVLSLKRSPGHAFPAL